jgi:hypothetical protein
MLRVSLSSISVDPWWKGNLRRQPPPKRWDAAVHRPAASAAVVAKLMRMGFFGLYHIADIK